MLSTDSRMMAAIPSQVILVLINIKYTLLCPS